ncbi:MAG: phosphonate C-P lyase system protein PhnH [Cyanobacteria bacterium P01_A01_bin.114]
MAVVAQTPGFVDSVHDAQRTFRAVLEALSQPGCVKTVDVALQPPEGLSVASAAVCLTLLDLEIQVWLQDGFPRSSRDWLLFHTGCRLTEAPEEADFALIWDKDATPDLSVFNRGTPEYPEASTTVLMQLGSLTQGSKVVLQGPGILEEITVSPQVSSVFWQQWQSNQARYPLGVDVLCLSDQQILGLPRSSRVV